MTERPSLFPPCPEPTADLAAAPPVATTLFVTGATKGFDRLAGLEGLRCLYVREISQPQLEIVAGMAWLEALSIFIYRGASLAPLRRMKNLRGLSVTAASKIDTLADIAAQTQLEELGVGDLKLVRDIAPLAALQGLHTLGISGSFTSPQRLDTLAPLASLTRVVSLSLDGVQVEDDDLRPIARMTQLRRLRIHPPKFPVLEHARLSVALAQTQCESFGPTMKGPRHQKWDGEKMAPDPSMPDLILVGRPMRILRSADPRAAKQIAARAAAFEAWQEWYRGVPDPAGDARMELPAPSGVRGNRR